MWMRPRHYSSYAPVIWNFSLYLSFHGDSHNFLNYLPNQTCDSLVERAR